MSNNYTKAAVSLIVTIAAFIFPFDSSAQYSREEAVSYLKFVVLADSTRPYDLDVSQEPVAAGAEVVCLQDRYRSPAFRSWLFLVDFNFGMRWTHPAHLFFVGVDSLQQVHHIDVGWWVTEPQMDDLGRININPFSRDEAIAYLQESLICDSLGDYEIYATIIPVPPGGQVIIAEGQDTVIAPNYPTWLLMVDWMWDFEWSHDAWLFFFDAEDLERCDIYLIREWVVSPELERIGCFGSDWLRMDALRFLTEELISDSVGSCEIFGSIMLVPPETVVTLEEGDAIISPDYTSWLFMVDWFYRADWSHTAWLYFIESENQERYEMHPVHWWVTSPEMEPIGMFGRYMSRDTTAAWLREIVLQDSSGPYELWGSKVPIIPGEVITLDTGQVGPIDWFPAWLFMVDWNYRARWSHRAYLYLQDIDELRRGITYEVDWPVESPEMERLGVFGEDRLRDEAFSYLKDVILRDSTNYYVEASREPVEARGDIVLGFGHPEDTLQAPDYQSWLFFIDWNYMLDGWPHNTHLYFIDVDLLTHYDHQYMEQGLPVLSPPMEVLGVMSVASHPSFIAPPKGLALNSLFPNPVNNYVRIEYALDASRRVEICVFNLRGQCVARLFDGFVTAGGHSLDWDVGGAPAGRYLVRVKAGSEVRIGMVEALK